MKNSFDVKVYYDPLERLYDRMTINGFSVGKSGELILTCEIENTTTEAAIYAPGVWKVITLVDWK